MLIQNIKEHIGYQTINDGLLDKESWMKVEEYNKCVELPTL